MRNGFTLIELLIAIAILVVVSVAGFIGVSRYKGGQDVELSTSELVSAIRDVERRAITERDGKQWGIRFINSTSTTHTYEVFSGASYATSSVERTYFLKRNIIFGNPADGLNIDAVFSAISGKLSEARIVSLVNKRKDGIVGDITMTSRGTITSRREYGVVGYWHFDEATSTSAYDASGFLSTGTGYSSSTVAATWLTSSSCKAGECLSFDGTDDYVDIGDPANGVLDFGSGDFSLVAWLYLDVLKDFNVVFQKQPSSRTAYEYTLNASGNVQYDATTCANAVTLSSPFTTGSWQHLVLVNKRGSSLTVYRNGVNVGSVSTCTSPSANAESFSIGRDGVPYSGYFDGRIDNVRIYNRALTATEILNLYNDLK